MLLKLFTTATGETPPESRRRQTRHDATHIGVNKFTVLLGIPEIDQLRNSHVVLHKSRLISNVPNKSFG